MPEPLTVEESSSPKAKRKKPVRARIPRAQLSKILTRQESIRRERPLWMRPFHELPIERALAYLEDLRVLIEDAGHVLTQRIGNERGYLRCSGPGCGISLDGLRPNGMPKYVAKWDFKDKKNPDIIKSVYFCSDLCVNNWNRSKGGAMGGTSTNAKTV